MKLRLRHRCGGVVSVSLQSELYQDDEGFVTFPTPPRRRHEVIGVDALGSTWAQSVNFVHRRPRSRQVVAEEFGNNVRIFAAPPGARHFTPPTHHRELGGTPRVNHRLAWVTSWSGCETEAGDRVDG
jgi:hypothetical protein